MFTPLVCIAALISLEFSVLLRERIHRPPAVELVKEKLGAPSGLRSDTPVFQDDRPAGQLLTSASVFAANGAHDGKRDIRVFAWIWTESTEDDGSSVKTKEEENIRTSALGPRIGRLNAGVKGNVLHKNMRQDWMFVSFAFQVAADAVNSQGQSSATVPTITTTEGGGDRYLNACEEGSLAGEFSIGMMWCHPFQFSGIAVAGYAVLGGLTYFKVGERVGRIFKKAPALRRKRSKARD
jgi:hypothetical protein